MDDVESVVEARKAAEAIRALNHATIQDDGYVWPSDVNAVVAELHLTVARMSQALGQARRWLARARAAGTVGHDQGGDINAVGVEVSHQFDTAASMAGRLASELDALHELTAHLTGVTTPGHDSVHADIGQLPIAGLGL